MTSDALHNDHTSCMFNNEYACTSLPQVRTPANSWSNLAYGFSGGWALGRAAQLAVQSLDAAHCVSWQSSRRSNKVYTCFFRTSPKYWGFTRVSRFHPTTEVTPDCWGFTRILRLRPNTKVSTEYSGFTHILRFHQTAEVSAKYCGFTRILTFQRNIEVSPELWDFT